MGKKPVQRILLCPKVFLFLGLAGAQEMGSVSLTRKALFWVLAVCYFGGEVQTENEETLEVTCHKVSHDSTWLPHAGWDVLLRASPVGQQIAIESLIFAGQACGEERVRSN